MKAAVRFYDELAAEPDLIGELVAGLDLRPRAIAPKFLYDSRGSELFERICELPEYYLTRTEVSILKTHGGDIARRVDPGAVLAASEGRGPWPHNVFAMYWPRATARSFAAA